MADILFFIIIFISNAVQAITGFAGTVLAMPPSILLVGIDNARVILNFLAWLSGLIIAIQNYRHINYKQLGIMIAFMTIGMIAGILIFNFFQSNTLLVIYGCAIVLIALRNLFVKQVKQFPFFVSILLLLLAGIFHGMFVSGGALLVLYAVRVLKNKDEFRATVAPVWVILNSFMMINYFHSGIVTSYSLKMTAISVVPLFLAIWIGNKIQKRINQHAFLILANILLVISGLSLVV